MTFWTITAENVEDLIKPELNEQFERERHDWFVTPLASQGKRTSGLFEVEFNGDKMIGLVINLTVLNTSIIIKGKIMEK